MPGCTAPGMAAARRFEENLAKRCSKEKYVSMRVCEVVTSKAYAVSSHRITHSMASGQC